MAVGFCSTATFSFISHEGKVIEPDAEGFLSLVSYMEVLSFQFQTTAEEQYVKELVSLLNVIDVNMAIADKVVQLRRTVRIKLPDAIIAATALLNNCTLVTHDVDHFIRIDGLTIYDPVGEHER